MAKEGAAEVLSHLPSPSCPQGLSKHLSVAGAPPPPWLPLSWMFCRTRLTTTRLGQATAAGRAGREHRAPCSVLAWQGDRAEGPPKSRLCAVQSERFTVVAIGKI